MCIRDRLVGAANIAVDINIAADDAAGGSCSVAVHRSDRDLLLNGAVSQNDISQSVTAEAGGVGLPLDAGCLLYTSEPKGSGLFFISLRQIMLRSRLHSMCR